MQTPAGKECPYFFGDYHRGRNVERCRLLEDHNLDWQAQLCFNCEVPEILKANACEHQSLKPRIEKPLLIGKPRVRVDAYCSQCECAVDEPRVGCGECHPLPAVFVVGPDSPLGTDD